MLLVWLYIKSTSKSVIMVIKGEKRKKNTSYSKDLPVGLAMRKAKILALETGLSQYEANN